MEISEELCEVVTVGGVFKAITTICRRNGVEGWEGPWEGRTSIFSQEVEAKEPATKRDASSEANSSQAIRAKKGLFLRTFCVFWRRCRLRPSHTPGLAELRRRPRERTGELCCRHSPCQLGPEASAPVLLHGRCY